MRTYPLIDQETGIKYAFEIENVYIGARRVAKVLDKVIGVSLVRCRRPFEANPEVHVTFNYKSFEFIVWEPYADNSRFWIGPREAGNRNLDISPIEKAFQRFRPSLISRAIGNFLMLRFLPGRSANH